MYMYFYSLRYNTLNILCISVCQLYFGNTEKRKKKNGLNQKVRARIQTKAVLSQSAHA